MLAPALALCALVSAAPSTQADPEDPYLVQLAETYGFRAGRPAAIAFSPDGRTAWFLRSGPRSRVLSLFETDLASGETRELLGPAALGGALDPTAAEAARMERQRSIARGITGFASSPDGKRLLVVSGGRLFVLERATGKLRSLADGVVDPRFAPDGRSIAYVKGADLHVLDLATGKERRITRAIGPRVTNGLAEFVAQEEMKRSEGYWWAPDAKRIAFAEVDESPVQVWTLCDPARPERPCRGLAYPAAGRANARVRLGIVRTAGGSPVWARWDDTRFPYLATVRWREGGPLAILVMDRRQRVEQLLAVDPATGATTLLLEERDADWLELDQDFPAFRRDGSFYWITERNGGPEVELRAADGTLVRTVVPPAAGFVRLAGHDREQDVLAFVASPDPTRTTVMAVRGEGAPAPVPLDPGPATWTARLSDRGGALAVTRSTTAEMARTWVVDLEGRRLADLTSVAEAPPFQAKVEIARVGEGDGLWTALVLPRAATAGPLPVIVDVYGGPAPPRAAHLPMFHEQWIADHGFAVVRVDGRGTDRRGRAFAREIRGFGTAILDDQIAGLRALAAARPGLLDLSRVGIAGWSYGGYVAARAVLERPDAFHAAVAGAPVVDWRDYDTFYTERYMGLPDADAAAYEAASLLPLAPGLSRPLLLVHGTADDNVWFSHTLKLADALFRAHRPFELLPVGGATHMVPDPVASRRTKEAQLGFFVRHLRPARPPVPAAGP